MKYTAEVVYEAKANHGECSWWDGKKNEVIYLDCAGSRLFCYNVTTAQNREIKLSFNPMAVVPCEEEGYIAASENIIYRLDESFAVTQKLADIDLGKSTNRFNDCKCGPDGSFYLGSMGTMGETDEGRFMRFDPDGSVHILLEKVGVSNGFAWTADQKRMYYTDTIHGEIYAFDYKEGNLSGKRVIFRDENLQPDGFCIDNTDRLWVALWKSGRVICIDPDAEGKIIHEVEVGAKQVSSTTLGGNNMDTLFITTSRLGLSEEELKSDPLAGSLFAVKVDAVGLELYRGRF